MIRNVSKLGWGRFGYIYPPVTRAVSTVESMAAPTPSKCQSRLTNGGLQSPFCIQTGNVAPAIAPAGAQKKNALFRAFPRHTCSISLWKDYLPTLRTQMHNAPIYCNITKKFIEGASGSGDGAIFATVKQLRHKLENLTQRGVWELQKGKTQTTKEEPLVVWSSLSKIQESGQSERGVLFRMVKERQSLR